MSFHDNVNYNLSLLYDIKKPLVTNATTFKFLKCNYFHILAVTIVETTNTLTTFYLNKN